MASLSLATRAMWSFKAVKAPMTGVTTFTSQRLIHTTRLALDEAKSEDAAASEAASDEAVPVSQKLPHRRRNFHKWLQSEGTRFETPSFSGPNFVGDVVRAPISDSLDLALP